MSVVTGALGSLATKLLQLLHSEYKLQKGVRKQVQWLHSELDSIHAFLRKVGDVPWDRLDEQIKVWVREVREASYDMEDALDTYLVRFNGGEPTDPSRLKRAMKKMSKVFSKAKARRSIAGAITEMKETLEEVAKRRQNYKLDDNLYKPLTTRSSIDPRLKAMYKEVTQLIGVDNSRDELISMLNPIQPDDDVSSKKMMKVSIVGVGGLGKTTLAKVVYDKLKSEYDCSAFVSIGRDHDLATVFKDILYHLDAQMFKDIHNTTKGAPILIDDIRGFLENKRYFVVIDDVWDVNTWETIQLALVQNNCGSKVITTSRNFKVAEKAGEVYKLKPLSNCDSKNLFHTRICSADLKYLDNHPDSVLDKILSKCAGIPLAIITMASLLVGKHEGEWFEVYKSISFAHKDNREVEDTMTILSFSYYDLPPHLRTCLLYLSTYPEDYLIRKESLIWKWIAQGFIDEKKGIRLFELGESYFNDLMNRSLIQVVENEWNGKVLGCRVHDMVLDLMRKLSFEENFISLLGHNVDGAPKPSSARRLAHQHRTDEHINSEATDTGISKVRSYIAVKCRISNKVQFLRLKLLRVLDIVDCSFLEGCHLEHLGDLLHLRYLGIKRCGDSVELPTQMGNLKLLQTIDVDITLPASIVQLTKLVRLCAKTIEAPDGIGNLTSLEELRIRGSFNTEGFPKELGRLRELRVLDVSCFRMDKSMQRDFVESVPNFKKIQHIRISTFLSDPNTVVWETPDFVFPQPLCLLNLPVSFSKLPPCITLARLPNLSHVSLWVTTLDEQDLKLLARLPALCFLYLVIKSTVTASNINAGDGWFFLKLRYFRITQMVCFEQPNEKDAGVSLHVWNGQGAMPSSSEKNNESSKIVLCDVMPNLEVLHFFIPLRALKDNHGDCGNIGIKYLPSLQKISVRIDCDGVSAEEVDAALAALTNICMVHPNHPSYELYKYNEGKMVSAQDKEDEKEQQEAEVVTWTADIDLGELSPA